MVVDQILPPPRERESQASETSYLVEAELHTKAFCTIGNTH